MADKERNFIKDEATYKALREDGASKQKAARIANARAAGGEPSKKGGQAAPYEDWSKAALYDRAKEIGIGGRSGMTKAELIHALREH